MSLASLMMCGTNARYGAPFFARRSLRIALHRRYQRVITAQSQLDVTL
jgi:hypothetical protein